MPPAKSDSITVSFDGSRLHARRFLCRSGHSGNTPVCDGSPARVGVGEDA